MIMMIKSYSNDNDDNDDDYDDDNDNNEGNNDNDACQDVSNDDVLKGLHWGNFVVMMMMMTKMMNH